MLDPETAKKLERKIDRLQSQSAQLVAERDTAVFALMDAKNGKQAEDIAELKQRVQMLEDQISRNRERTIQTQVQRYCRPKSHFALLRPTENQANESKD